MGLFSKLKEGLTKTRDNIVSGIDSIFSGCLIFDADFDEELEDVLIQKEEIIEELQTRIEVLENK